MQVHWLIEAGVFPETAPRMCRAIEARGDRWTRYEDGLAEAELPPREARVVFWGSLGAAYRDRVAARWRPGAIGDVEQFRVASYAPRLGPLLANSDAVMTTVRDLVENRDDVLARLNQPQRVFVRPDSALKPFAGRVLDASAIDRSALDHGFYYDDDALPIAVAPARRIDRECAPWSPRDVSSPAARTARIDAPPGTRCPSAFARSQWRSRAANGNLRRFTSSMLPRSTGRFASWS